jgi:hypothetical protein
MRTGGQRSGSAPVNAAEHAGITSALEAHLRCSRSAHGAHSLVERSSSARPVDLTGERLPQLQFVHGVPPRTRARARRSSAQRGRRTQCARTRACCQRRRRTQRVHGAAAECSRAVETSRDAMLVDGRATGRDAARGCEAVCVSPNYLLTCPLLWARREHLSCDDAYQRRQWRLACRRCTIARSHKRARSTRRSVVCHNEYAAVHRSTQRLVQSSAGSAVQLCSGQRPAAVQAAPCCCCA